MIVLKLRLQQTRDAAVAVIGTESADIIPVVLKQHVCRREWFPTGLVNSPPLLIPVAPSMAHPADTAQLSKRHTRDP